MNLETTCFLKDVHVDYFIGQIIGTGSFSTVSECYHKITGETFAVKTISKQTFRNCRQAIENEIRILKKSSHSNIIKLFKIYDNEDYLYLIMELIRGGELFTEISDNGAFTEIRANKIFSQIFDGVKYLHSFNITHRDLKLENILIDSQSRVKLSDFGLSKILEPSDEEFMKTRCGTPCYVAPEILLGENYTSSVDIWSMGVILYVMVYSRYPFQSSCLHSTYESIIHGNFDLPCTVSNELQDLLKGLLKVKDRFTLDDIANHAWMKKFKDRQFLTDDYDLENLSNVTSILRDLKSSSEVLICL